LPQKVTREPGWLPRFSFDESDGRITFQAELPEVSADDIDISAGYGVLTISGERDYEKKAARRGYRFSETGRSTFSRSFRLPDNAEWEQAEAALEEKVLTVTIPLAPATEPRRIEIQTP
jgi:HSP20 family protein